MHVLSATGCRAKQQENETALEAGGPIACLPSSSGKHSRCKAVVRHFEFGKQPSYDMLKTLMRYFCDSPWLQGLQKATRRIRIKLLVSCFDTNEKSIPTCQRKTRDIEHWVVRHRQPIESQHPEN